MAFLRGSSPKRAILALLGPPEGLFYINPSRRGPAVPAGGPPDDRAVQAQGSSRVGARGRNSPPSSAKAFGALWGSAAEQALVKG